MISQKRMTIITVLFTIALLALALTNVFGLVHWTKTTDRGLWFSRLEFWGILLVIFLFTKIVEKRDFFLWPEQKKGFLFYFLSPIVLLIGLIIILVFVSLILHEMGIVQNKKIIREMTAIMCEDKALLVFGCLTAAFVEEFIFRGFLLPRFQAIFNKTWIAILLSSILFGLCHIGYADIGMVLFPSIIGLVFSVFYFKYKSLTVLIICHFLIDFGHFYIACKMK